MIILRGNSENLLLNNIALHFNMPNSYTYLFVIYPYVYIRFTELEVKQMKDLGDWTSLFFGSDEMAE